MKSKQTKITDKKALHIQMPRATWILLKQYSLIHDVTMGQYLIELIEKQRKKLMKKIMEMDVDEAVIMDKKKDVNDEEE